MAHRAEPGLQVFSDLHLEFYPRESAVEAVLERWIRPMKGASACILAGDIAVPTGSHRWWLEVAFRYFSERYQQVFYVPGNHEFYGCRAAEALDKIRSAVARYPKVTLLEPGVRARWGSRQVLGATLWFRPDKKHPRLASSMPDFSKITEFVPWVYEQNGEHVGWLSDQVRHGDIVVTHHLPARASIAGRYSRDPLNTFFLCNMERLIEERQPALWVHGHTHDSCRYEIGPTTVLCNPLGYLQEENPAFDTGAWSPPKERRRPHSSTRDSARRLADAGGTEPRLEAPRPRRIRK